MAHERDQRRPVGDEREHQNHPVETHLLAPHSRLPQAHACTSLRLGSHRHGWLHLLPSKPLPQALALEVVVRLGELPVERRYPAERAAHLAPPDASQARWTRRAR